MNSDSSTRKALIWFLVGLVSISSLTYVFVGRFGNLVYNADDPISLVLFLAGWIAVIVVAAKKLRVLIEERFDWEVEQHQIFGVFLTLIVIETMGRSMDLLDSSIVRKLERLWFSDVFPNAHYIDQFSVLGLFSEQSPLDWLNLVLYFILSLVFLNYFFCLCGSG